MKEFQQEYFCRIAIVLDTFLPLKPRPKQLDAFEAAISVVASIADYFSQSEHIVDIFAAGPDVYQVSAGRSLAYLENILDVLACLEPCHQPPFEAVGPVLFETPTPTLGSRHTFLAEVGSRPTPLQPASTSPCTQISGLPAGLTIYWKDCEQV